MALTQRSDRNRRELAFAVPPLPHPSWGRPSDPSEHQTLRTAADFWNRLGL
jgi:hypothetical protein